MWGACHVDNKQKVSKVLELSNLLQARYLTPDIQRDQTDTMAATKVALITASSAGLGAQIARVFAPDFRVVRRPL